MHRAVLPLLLSRGARWRICMPALALAVIEPNRVVRRVDKEVLAISDDALGRQATEHESSCLLLPWMMYTAFRNPT